VREDPQSGLEPIDSLAQGVEEAIALLRDARYPLLQQHLPSIEEQAAGMRAFKQALLNGSPPPRGARESCERLGRRLHVLSEVVRHVAEVEFALTRLVAWPGESPYGRDGHCGQDGAPKFQQEA
jgi:hypothetical protein